MNPIHVYCCCLLISGMVACSSPTQEPAPTIDQPVIENHPSTTVETPSTVVDDASEVPVLTPKKPRSPYQELKQHRRPFGKDEIVNQFPGADFDYAVVYALDPDRRNGATSVFKGRTGPSKRLSKTEVAPLNAIINTPETYGDGPAGCFDPRIGLVYYDKDSLPVAHVSICFECSQFKAYPKLKSQEQHEDYLHGLSEKGAVQLKYCFAEWGFPNTGFNPMSDGKLTLEYLKTVLPKALGEEEAALKIEQYQTLFEEHNPD